MIHDSETGETITAGIDDLFEHMARHLAKRIGACDPPDIESATLTGVRMGIAFMASMFDQATDTGNVKLTFAVLKTAIAQRDAWGMKEATEVEFVNMSHLMNDARH